MNNKFAIKTLGCKVNQYEEQSLREGLARLGYEEAPVEDADIFIVNSCTVTQQADSKTRNTIRKAKKLNPSLKIFVTGCYAVNQDDVEFLESMAEVFKVVRNKDKMELPAVIDPGRKYTHVEGISDFSAHTRAFLKMQDGCDQSCSYCKVNMVRGPSVSRNENEIYSEIRRLHSRGYNEIVLTGICLGSWRGEDGRKLSDVVKGIDELEGNFRIRLSSLEPNHIDADLINSVANSSKICDHFHIPLQSGSDSVLGRMARRYDTLQFKELISNIRNYLPNAGITFDIIVGFPGETENELHETLKFLDSINPSRLHVFKYSDRKGTPASKMQGKINAAIAKSRVDKVINRGEYFHRAFCQSFINKEVTILIESITNDIVSGYTAEYVRAETSAKNARKGELITTTAVSVDPSQPILRCKSFA